VVHFLELLLYSDPMQLFHSFFYYKDHTHRAT